MKIENLAELEQLVTMLNKHGVTNITVDGISLQLSGEPQADVKQEDKSLPQTPDAYTDEQILMWSASPIEA
jgi:hypothetical protein